MNIIKNYGEIEINENIEPNHYTTTIIKTKVFNEFYLMSVGICNGGHFEQDKLKYNESMSEDENLQNFIEYLIEQSDNELKKINNQIQNIMNNKFIIIGV